MKDLDSVLEVLTKSPPVCFQAVRGETVKLCSWCKDSTALTCLLASLKVEMTHGICPECLERVKGNNVVLNYDNINRMKL